MTISTTIIKNSYSGNGSTTVFNYTFKITDQDEIQVIIRSSNGTETIKTTSHYTVTGVGNPGGGSITFNALNIPTSSETVILRRDTPQTQNMDLIDNDPMDANTIEDAFDKLTSITQELQEENARSIKLSRTNTIGSTEFTVGSVDRANKILAFDDNGELSVTQEAGTFKGTDATTTTVSYKIRDLVKSSSTSELNNVYIALDNTSAGDLLTDTSKFAILVDAVSASAAQTAASSSATAASNSAAAALVSENNSSTSETNSSNSATASANSATASAASASAASTSETNSANSAASSTASQTAAASSASAASASATAAAASQTAAAASENAAATSEANSLTHSNSSNTSATNSANSATASANSATNSANSATASAASASSASSSATSAASAQTAAESARDSTLAAYDNFDDRYLGAKSSDPTVDNDGNSLIAGSLYFSTTDEIMKVYTGSTWVDAYAAGNTFLAKANNLSDLQNAGTARTNLGVAIGSDVQAHNTVLDNTTATYTTALNTKLGGIATNATNNQNTDSLNEGSTNLYYTNARADARIAAASINNLSDVDTTGISSGQILKYDGTNFTAADDSSVGLVNEQTKTIATTQTITTDSTKYQWLYGPITIASGVVLTVGGNGSLDVVNYNNFISV